MRFAFLPRCLAYAALLITGAAGAQQLPPIEPPEPMPILHSSQAPALRVTTTEVLVPTLVEEHNGDIIYGLKPKDFLLEDNGVPQKIHVQSGMDRAPVALVVAVELGGASVLEFGKLAKLGPLLELFLAAHGSEVALVGFDSTQHLIQDFTHSGGLVDKELTELQPGDGGAAILDTVSYAVNLLQTQPRRYRRVLLLISEERDHGSKHTRPAQLIRQIGESDVLVLSVAFSPAKAQFVNDLSSQNEGGSEADLMAPLRMLIHAMRKNVTKEIAQLSGGEYMTFNGTKGFEARVVSAAAHMRNRYLITFSPSNPTPGLHTIKVRLAQDYRARIVARANYWITPQTNSDP